ncbi:hypothetical protein [Bacillus massilinigeriensis]|uniref:hypothetical protein n=1 Tax=Bacillus massilionigeriensis TaxID=1805475 RepID=UPI00096B1CE6|nr:hypothetical protein [Bacillus massilionigeriensis]
MDKKLKLIEVLILLSGSVMEREAVLKEYQKLTPPKKKYLYNIVKPIFKKYNRAFDEAQPLLVVNINVCAAENNVDPAVALLAGISKGK